MSFLKNLFGSSQGNEQPDAKNPNEQKKVKQTVHDFFKIDLRNIPDDSFIEGNSEINSKGTKFKNYRKNLDYFECDIFDTIEIKYFSPTDQNVIFINFNWKRDISPIKRLIDELYLLYGDDDLGAGRFNVEDQNAIINRTYWSGRMWADTKKFKYGIMISDDNNIIKMSVHGTKA